VSDDSDMTLVPKTGVGKRLRALRYCLARPSATLRSLRSGLIDIYREGIARESRVPVVTLQQLVGNDAAVVLSDFFGRNGNVRLEELVSIASIVHHCSPRVLLEIGTFDGNTALQMANNAPEDALVYTLDLPSTTATAHDLDPIERAYVDDRSKLDRKYAHSPNGRKVVQCLGDSATFDFRGLLAGRRVDLAFIDGSHTHDYVRNDTERVLEVLAPGGVVLWHDFTPAWPGVVAYLTELARELPLVRIAGTSLVCLNRRSGSSAR
jgi:predicted O-methyltransferase YrrM